MGRAAARVSEEERDMRATLRAELGGAILLLLATPLVPGGRAGTDEETSGPASFAGGRFDVEVLVGGRPREEFVAIGRRYVEAIEGAEYEVRITNPLDVRVGVALAVDGRNTIDARRTPAEEASLWVIGPHQEYTVSGWQMSTSRARRFVFTTERDSYAARLGLSSDPGVISATFFRERNPIAVMTPRRYEADSGPLGFQDEAAAPSAAARAGGARPLHGRESARERDADRAATGIGRSVRHEVRSVDMELEPRPVAEVTIRYKYRPELYRLGVLPRPAPEPDGPRSRARPSALDDRRFCPEP
jgi:hypothetical protein